MMHRSTRPWHRTRRLSPPQVAPSVSGDARPRVLLECPPEKSPSIVAHVLEREGLDVVVCEGPEEHHRCPLATGESCGAVAGVDVVVNMLGDNRPERAEVLPALMALEPEVPAIVAEVLHEGETIDGVETVTRRSTASEVVQAVERAMARHAGSAAGV